MRQPLSGQQKIEIGRLATSMKHPTAHKIARLVGARPVTVNWHLIRHGLVDRKLKYKEPFVYTRRNGKVIHRYRPEHDELIVILRRSGHTYLDIAEALVAAYSIPRTAHSIKSRLLMLSTYEGGPEA